MNKRSVFLALAAVLVVSAAAYAHGGGFPGMGGFEGMGGYGHGEYHRGECQRDGDEGDARGSGIYRGGLNAEVPQDVRDRMQELRRTHLEMRLALSQDKPDVNTARLLFGKAQKLQNEIAKWRFEKYMETLSR
ncbi:MAG: hypothetical protein RQ767_07685 [Thermovirgaceae bacterium]|nr:hypothetical protein [Thermovirgaceae bacterium]